MSHLKIVVSQNRIEYKGPFDLNNLFKLIDNFIWERGFEKRQEKDFEQNTPSGKFIEWQSSPWKTIYDYGQYIIKFNITGFDVTKSDVMVEGKKKKVDNGRILIVIDAFVNYDRDNFWEGTPLLYFWRVLHDYFIFKAYTERFEQVLVHDVNHVHDLIEKYLNVYRHYSVISRKAP